MWCIFRISLFKPIIIRQIKKVICSAYMINSNSSTEDSHYENKKSNYYKYIGIGTGIAALIYYNFYGKKFTMFILINNVK